MAGRFPPPTLTRYLPGRSGWRRRQRYTATHSDHRRQEVRST